MAMYKTDSAGEQPSLGVDAVRSGWQLGLKVIKRFHVYTPGESRRGHLDRTYSTVGVAFLC